MKTVSIKIIVLALLLELTMVTAVQAGTWMLGLKGWYTSWESSVIGWYEKNTEALFAANGVPIDVKKESGTGYLAGPVIGYQTDGGEWSFSLAAMVFSQFNQSVDIDGGDMDITTDGNLERQDFDIVATYSLFKYSDSFSLFKYQNLFFGCKYQLANMDLDISFETLGPTKVDHNEIEQAVIMPTIGTGFSFPLWRKTAVGLQLGLLYVIPDMTFKNDDGTHNIWTEPSFGFNGEITFSYLPFNSLVLQLGYRYQAFSLTAGFLDDPDAETESPDITQGLTLTAVYLF